jgi:hypothetical protein
MTRRKYLWEARAGDGTARSGFVDAESVADARARLAADGLSDAVVHDDDFLSDLRAAGSKESDTARVADLEVMLRHEPTAFAMVRYVVRANWGTWVLMLATLAALAAFGVPWWIFAIALAVLAWFLYATLFPGWLQWQQNEMQRTCWRGEWDAAERIARRLRKLKMVENLHSVKLELDGRIAGCLVMKGERERAYAQLEPWKAYAPLLPPGLFLIKLNGLHFLARDWDAALATYERVFEETRGSDTARIDLALMLARLGHDDARAAELLDALDPQKRVPMQDGFIAWARGVLALKRGDDAGALRELARGVAALEALAKNPITWGALALATGYLAVAMARTGRLEAARQMLAPALPIVGRHGEDLLMALLRAAKLAA